MVLSKRIMAIFIICLLSFSLCFLVGCDGNKDSHNSLNGNEIYEFTYKLVEGGYSVESYNGSDINVVVPSKHNGLPVISIGYRAFYKLNIYQVKLPETIKTIAVDAFSDCTNLIEINIPCSVTLIEQRAFYRCTRLTSLNIPSSVNSIGENAFILCERIKEVYINNSYVYTSCISSSACGYLLEYTQKAIVPCEIVEQNQNEFLEDSSIFSKVKDGSNYIFTKV